MRGDGVGVGDVGAVYDRGTGGARERELGGDGGGAGRKPVGGVLDGCGELGCSVWEQSRRDGVGVGDGTRGGAGSGWAYSDGAGWTDGMRGDGVGVGDVGAVPCSKDAWGQSRSLGDVRRADRIDQQRAQC